MVAARRRRDIAELDLDGAAVGGRAVKPGLPRDRWIALTHYRCPCSGWGEAVTAGEYPDDDDGSDGGEGRDGGYDETAVGLGSEGDHGRLRLDLGQDSVED